jgi:hypothetical protein
MRNLKKVLALVLALVMSLSLVTIAHAADFSDAAEIDYDEAVAVMSTIGVIDGVGNNSFDPDGTLTREQAAKLIAYMLMGNNAEKLGVEQSSFNDVAATRWSAPAIEYCATLGIIDGAGDGNFYPAGKLTGYAFAKMLLTALGYDSKIEGFTGSSWTINVATVAMEAGLDDGLETMFGSAEISRQEAAQMALNAIKTPLVTYEKSASLTVNGAEVNIGSAEAKYVTTTLAREQRIGTQTLTNSNEYTVEFGEKYFPGLRLNVDDDKFERPSHTWIFEREEIGTYVDYDILVEQYTTGVSGKTLYELLGRSNVDDYDLYYYVDGELRDDVITKANINRGNTQDYRTTGNGVLTQVFVDHEANKGTGLIVITSINTWLAQANSNYNTSRETLSLKVYENSDGVNKTVDAAEVPGIEDIEKDEYVLVNMSKKDTYNHATYEVVKVSPVEIMTDCTVTRFSKRNSSDNIPALFSSVTSNGTKYDASYQALYSEDVLDLYDNSLLTDTSYNIYLDPYGYAIGVDLFEGELNYVFITGYNLNESSISVGNATAAAIFLDGTMKEITVDVSATNKNIDKLDGSNSNDTGDGVYYDLWSTSNATLNRWYSYTANGSTYTLRPAASWDRNAGPLDGSGNPTGATVYRMMATEVLASADEKIKCNNVRVDEKFYQVSGGAGAFVDDLYAFGDDDSIYITVGTGGVTDPSVRLDVITKVEGRYTGVQNVEIEVDGVATGSTGTTKGTITGTALTESIYTLFDKDNYIIASIVVGDAKGGNTNYAYILSEAKAEGRDSDGNYYWEFDAVVDGEIREGLVVRSKFSGAMDELVKDHVQELRFDGEYVIGVEDVADVYGADGDGHDTKDILVPSVTERIGSDSAVYDVGHIYDGAYPDCDISGHTAGGARLDGNDLHLQRRTLYVGITGERGLTFVEGAKAVVIQTVNGEARVKTQYDSVADAIAALGDPVTGTPELEYKGRITAVLNSSGVAKWVVFNSDTPVTTGSGNTGNGREYTITVEREIQLGNGITDELESVTLTRYQSQLASGKWTILATDVDDGIDLTAYEAVSARKTVTYVAGTYEYSIKFTFKAKAGGNGGGSPATDATIASAAAAAGGSNTGNAVVTPAATVDDGASTIKVTVEHKAANGDTIVVTPTLNDANAILSDATVTLTYTAGTWGTGTVTATAEDGTTTKDYTVSVDETLCDKTDVQSASATGGAGGAATVAPTATVNNTAHTITVTVTGTPNAGDTITVSATVNSADHSSASADVTLTYDGGSSSWNTNTITITAEDGTTQAYTVSVA